MNKTDLRKILTERRGGIADRAQKDACIQSLLLRELNSFGSVFIYASMGSEVCTHGIIDKLLLQGKTVYVPYTGGDMIIKTAKPMLPVNYTKVSRFGNIDSVVCDGQAAVAVVPLLGYNDDLYRIGYGAGCYDRYFFNAEYMFKIGLAYSAQKCAFTPNKTDVGLDAIITENGILRRDK